MVEEDEYKSQGDSDEREDDDDDDQEDQDEAAVFERDHFEKLTADIADSK